MYIAIDSGTTGQVLKVTLVYDLRKNAIENSYFYAINIPNLTIKQQHK